MLTDESRRAVIRTLRTCPVVDEIQQWLNRRPGRRCSISVEAALFAIIVAAALGYGTAGRIDKATGILRDQTDTDNPLGLPDHLVGYIQQHPKDQHPGARRRFYRRLRRTLKAIGRWAQHKQPDGQSNLDRLTHTLLLASVPVHVRNYNSYTLDSAGTRASHTHHRAKNNPDLPDHLNQADWRVRTYTNDDGTSTDKLLYGYGLHILGRCDPTNNDPTLWLAHITLTKGSTSETNVALDMLTTEAKTNPIFNLLIADRGYTQSPRIHHTMHDHHGDVIQDLKAAQDRPYRTKSGIWAIGGGAYDPATPPNTRTYPRRTINQPLNDYLNDRENSLGPFLLKHHTPPDIHGVHRYQGNCVRQGADCPLQPIHARKGGPTYLTPPGDGHNLALCQGRTIQLSREDYDIPTHDGTGTIPTYQPIPYGTHEHAAIYHPWRNRTEGALSDLTEHRGMWGGRHGFKVRRVELIQLFALAAAVAHNLRRQGHFPPEHGTDNLRNDTVLILTDTHRTNLQRILNHRHRIRTLFNPATCPHHTHPTPTSPLTVGGTDPPV